jgi:hypothetical protein
MCSSGGKLYGKDTQDKKHSITTTNPKIYYSPGNCFIAMQPSADCYSNAWLHNGANAFFGHVDVQYPGRLCCAWGISSFFFELQDRFTYAEAIYLNRQAAWAHLTNWMYCLGCTVFYGDPAWDCRMKKATTPIYDQTLDVVDKGDGKLEITFTITMNMDSALARCVESAAAFLPQRIKNPEVISCDADGHTIADNFVLMRKKGTLSEGTTLTLAFTADKQ